ncbi:hypothetical protein [Flavobacterium granuli]|uniref:Bifunctional metallophosphatase/5'-nucleotidase n=1 Tax=Flavobacterium granuli TaxID=280093 RepID=A0A1M5TW74_9FLAO|nr:hypothetical protein [Flavobacterium granuli]PRZ22879.1 hypothetical protein BC624_106128 [Flavobacterium granuli]SHH54979.1 hypothetical protein SAMN05443373_1169 [Flavobacterium granuli]
MKYLYAKILFFFIIATALSQETGKTAKIKFVHLTDLHVSVV